MADQKAFSEETSSDLFELVVWHQAMMGEGRC